MPDTPGILLSRVNQITMSDVSRLTTTTKMQGVGGGGRGREEFEGN